MKKICILFFGALLIFLLDAPCAKAFEVDMKDVVFDVHGFAQAQYVYEEHGNDDFKAVRERLRVKGRWDEHLSFFTQLDVRLDNILCDVFVDLNYFENATIRVGQFCLPFGKQTPINPYNLLTIDYSQVVSALNGGDDLRDQGIVAYGSYYDVDYALGITNGEGRNTSDENDRKTFVGRLGYKPLRGLELGISCYEGDRGKEKYDRKRVGADVKYKYDRLLFQGEYVHSDDEKSDDTKHTWPGEGYFVEFGYEVTPALQPVIKYDVWNPKSGYDYDKSTIVALGLNWYFSDWSKLQMIYEFNDKKDCSEDECDNDKGIIQLGVEF
jgi:hypothetical protein